MIRTIETVTGINTFGKAVSVRIDAGKTGFYACVGSRVRQFAALDDARTFAARVIAG